MTESQYQGWAEGHCEMTGAVDGARLALLANRKLIADENNATVDELVEVTERLIRSGNTPRFANDHSQAVIHELRTLRRERNSHRSWDSDQAGPRCVTCNDTGLVTVPLYLCVERPRFGEPRLVPHPLNGMFMTGCVICDLPGCDRGRLVADDEQRRDEKKIKHRQRWSAYITSLGGIDILRMMRNRERALAEEARATTKPDGEFLATIRSVYKKLAELPEAA